MSEGALTGRRHVLGPDLAVLSMPRPESLPIPLRVATPEGIALLTWAFAGPADAGAARMLLVLAGQDAVWADALVLATHYGDVPLCPVPAAQTHDLPGDALSGEDRVLLGRAVLAGMNPALHAHRRALAGLMEAAADALVPEADAPRVALGPSACTLDGTAVPDHLFVRMEGGSGLARVARARLDLGAVPALALDLDYGGPAPEGTPRAVLALHAHAVRALRLGAA